MALAMEETNIQYIISFTIKREGTLIDGTSIFEAIQYIDHLVEQKPICYMTNCVHPTILRDALSTPENDNAIVRRRFLGIQANTSALDYAQLEEGKDLKSSSANEFAKEMLALKRVSNLKIFGGCCGTDDKYMEQVARKLVT